MPPVTGSLGEGTQSVLLTAAILREIAEGGDGAIGISDIARKLGTSKSRVFRHVQTLVACGFLTRSAGSDLYSAGPALIALSRSIHERHDILATARPVMERLHARLGHTVIISQVARDGIRVLQSVSSGQPIVLEIRPGTILPFRRSAQGLVAMAWHDPARAGRSDGLTDAVRLHGERLAADLREVRGRGWAIAQMREGMLGVAAPILDDAGTMVATLALLDTAPEMQRSVEADAPRILREAAREIAKLMAMRA